jgi:hypothetical protein
MAWLKKFIDYSRDVKQYSKLCTCPAHTEYQTAIIFHAAKKLKLDLEILSRLSSENQDPVAPGGLNFTDLSDENKKKIFEDLTSELCELDEKFVSLAKNLVILKYLMRSFYHYGNIKKFEVDILYTPISKIYNANKAAINSG